MTALSPRTASPAPLRGQRALPRESRRGTARGWVWLLAASVLGVTGALEPLLTLMALVGGAVLVLAIAAPRITAGLTALVVLFVRPLEHLVPIPQVGYMDEGLIVLCLITMPLRRLIARQPLRDFPGQWWFAGFIVCGVLSALVVQVPTGTFFLGAFIVSKGLLLRLGRRPDRLERAAPGDRRARRRRVDRAVRARRRDQLRGARTVERVARERRQRQRGTRSFLPSLIGPFTHPIDFGQFMALSFIAVAAWRAAVRPQRAHARAAARHGHGALASARRTSIGGLVAGWLWMQAKVRSTSVLMALLAGLPIVIVVLCRAPGRGGHGDLRVLPRVGRPRGPHRAHERLVLVAASYFPAGAGFGRFGSAVAATNYSPEYVALRLSRRSGGSAAPPEDRALPHRHRMAGDHRRDGLLRRAGVRARPGGDLPRRHAAVASRPHAAAPVGRLASLVGWLVAGWSSRWRP